MRIIANSAFLIIISANNQGGPGIGQNISELSSDCCSSIQTVALLLHVPISKDKMIIMGWNWVSKELNKWVFERTKKLKK